MSKRESGSLLDGNLGKNGCTTEAEQNSGDRSMFPNREEASVRSFCKTDWFDRREIGREFVCNIMVRAHRDDVHNRKIQASTTSRAP
jgi:hypothetical protein